MLHWRSLRKDSCSDVHGYCGWVDPVDYEYLSTSLGQQKTVLLGLQASAI